MVGHFMKNLDKLITAIKALKEDVSSCCAFTGPTTAQLAPYPVPALCSNTKRKNKKVKIDEDINESFIDDIKVFLLKSQAEESEAVSAYLERANKCKLMGLPILANLFEELAKDETIHLGCIKGALEHLGLSDDDKLLKGQKEYMELASEHEKEQGHNI